MTTAQRSLRPLTTASDELLAAIESENIEAIGFKISGKGTSREMRGARLPRRGH
jgi:hypothetical protein